MNKDRSVFFGLIGYVLAITGLLVYAYLMRDITLPEDFMVMPDRMPISSSSVVTLISCVILVIYISTVKEETKVEN